MSPLKLGLGLGLLLNHSVKGGFRGLGFLLPFPPGVIGLAALVPEPERDRRIRRDLQQMGALGMSLVLQLNLPPASSTLPCISPAQGSLCRRRIFLGGRGAGRSSVRRKDGVRSGRQQLRFLVAASLQDEKETATTSSSTTKSFEESSSDTSVVSSSSSSSSAAAVSWVVPRRFVLGTSVALLVALGANFLGVTSALLSLNPALSRAARVDVLYPVQGYKRCLETSRGFGKRALLSILYLSSYFAFIFAIFFFPNCVPFSADPKEP
jgi:hypothetical protein